MVDLKGKPIIGLVGLDCSGKTTVSDYLVKRHGFKKFSLSDVIRAECKEKGLSLDTENLIKIGGYMRDQYGNDVLVQKILPNLEPNTKYVIDSIRHPDEIKALMLAKPRFRAVSIDAPLYDRWKRSNHRKREGEIIGIEEFAKRDSSSLYTPNSGQQIAYCQPMADFSIFNMGIDNDKELHSKIEQLLVALERPDWDIYYMKKAHVTKSRSTCDRLAAGAEIWHRRNHRPISSGYNGAPPGRPTCDDIGHEMVEGHCIRTRHSEENALANVQNPSLLSECGISITATPCYSRCYKAIITSGIQEIHWDDNYREDPRILEDAKKYGVTVKRVTVPKTRII